MVPLSSARIPRVPAYSSSPKNSTLRVRDYHPVSFHFPVDSTSIPFHYSDWAPPISLAATLGISVDFFSSGYLDVSVPQVRLVTLCIQITISDKSEGLPHSEILGSMLVVSSPRLIADCHVL